MKLFDFDTLIFDLDFTIWDGSEPDFWAKKLVYPCTFNSDKIVGGDGKFIRLQPYAYNILSELYRAGKNLGFITLGGLLDVSHDEQPPVKCLKTFDIYNFFNHQRTVLYKTDIKSKYVNPMGKTLFIDDNVKNLVDVEQNCPNVSVLDRNSFKSWSDLL